MRTEAYEAMSDHPVFSEGMIEIAESFVVEAKDILDEINKDIPQLEQADASLPLIDKMFRGIHTVKGLSTFLRLEQLSLISHRFEEVLNRFREGEQDFHPGIRKVMLRAVEAMNQLVQQVPARSIALIPLDGLLEDLNLLAKDGFSEEIIPKNGNSELKQTPSDDTFPRTVSSIRMDVEKLDGMLKLLDGLNLSRIRIERIVGELDPGPANHGKLGERSEAASALGHFTYRMHSAVTQARLVSAADVFKRFQAFTRELARDLGKEVDLVFEGGDIVIDKAIVDDLTDSLLHLARNAVDHGIELPHERIRRDKPIRGRILLTAACDGSHVVITIEDDGDGIDVQKLCRRAVDRGIMNDLEASTMASLEVMDLIFKPGFTTHDEATRISGRGVGMDVVKTSVQRLGGTVSVESETGRYTRFTLCLPPSAPSPIHP